jgi:hypothetical protein
VIVIDGFNVLNCYPDNKTVGFLEWIIGKDFDFYCKLCGYVFGIIVKDDNDTEL